MADAASATVTAGNEPLEHAVALITAYELDGREQCKRILKLTTASDEDLILALAGIARMLAVQVGRSGILEVDSTQEVLEMMGSAVLKLETGEIPGPDTPAP
jgi:hypothetical protein